MKCLLPDKVEEFKQALKNKEINLSDLLNLDHDQLVEKLKPYAGSNAADVATMLEEKLILKNRVLGLTNALSKLTESGKYSPERVAENKQILSEYRAAQQERIFSPKEHESYLQGIADKKLGFSVSKEVAAKVSELSAKVRELADKNPKMSGVSDEYLIAKADLHAYVQSQKPISAGVSIGKNVAIIARNNLLLNPSTPVKTTAGQLVNSAIDMITRRIGTLSLKGNDYTLARKANAEAWETFRKTGLNTAVMENEDDMGKLGEGSRFNVAVGMESRNPLVRGIEATVRNVAKVSNKIAIDYEHNITFTKFYQKAFFDMANILSSKVAKEAGKDSSAIFADAVKIKPETLEGAMVRLESQRNAARVTNTNETFLGEASLKVKDALNYVPGLGDALMPIAKIPSNIIYNGIENAGVGLPHGALEVYRGYIKMQSDDLATKYKGMGELASGIQRIGRTVGVLSAAAYFTSTLTKQDFKTDKYGASFVKIAGVWVNMEYANAVSPALAGMMEVKKQAKHNQGADASTGQYIAGAAKGLLNLPLYSDISGAIQSITNPTIAKGINKYAANFFSSRGVPSFIHQLRNGQGVKGLLFSTSGLPTQQELKKLGAK